MNNKKLIAMTLMLLLLLVIPVQVFAEESVTAKVPFSVENAPGTVVMEAVNDEPVPVQAEFTDVSEGTFEILFVEPGDYYYRVYQNSGSEPGVSYDGTVYDVVISVFWETNGELYAVVTVSQEDSAFKPERIAFMNQVAQAADVRIEKTQVLNGGMPTNEKIYVVPGDEITYFITVENISTSIVRDMIVTDKIPEGLIPATGSIDNGGLLENRVVTWELGDMEENDSITLSFRVTVPDVTEETVWGNVAEGSFVEAVYAGRRLQRKTNEVEAEHTSEEVTTTESGTEEEEQTRRPDGIKPDDQTKPADETKPAGESSSSPQYILGIEDNGMVIGWILVVTGGIILVIAVVWLIRKKDSKS